MKRALAVMIVLTGIAAFGPAPAASAKVKVVSRCNTHKPSKKPAAMVFTCGDAGLQAMNLSWRNWGGRRAKAKGTIVYKLCDPDCAAGGVAYRSGKVTLYGKVRCHRHFWVYSRARVKVWNGPTTRMRMLTCR